MIRTPLRPLARILEARANGENPDTIERENLAIRHEAMRDTARSRAENRLMILAFGFHCVFGDWRTDGHFGRLHPRRTPYCGWWV